MSTANKQIFVFVSHKHTDKQLAARLINILQYNSSVQNVTFFAEERISAGDDWRRRIDIQLKQARYLILIYTGLADDWTWCVSECTMFVDFEGQEAHYSAKKVYCIHPPGLGPPNPLSNIQSIPAQRDNIVNWLTQFYNETGHSPAPSVVNSVALRLAKTFREWMSKHESVSKPSTSQSFLRSISINPHWPKHKKKANWLNVYEIPKRLPRHLYEVSANDEESAEFFKLPRKTNVNMMEFFKKLDADGAGGPWVKPFLDAFDKRLRGDMPTQEIFYFRSSLDGKVLRPVIESIERSGDGCSCTCRVVFLEGFNPPMVRDPSMVEQLADGLRLAFRTRNEVLNKYKEKLDVKRQLISGPNGLSDQIVEIMGTIRQETTMQCYQLDGTASEFFLGKDKSEYNRIHN